MKSKKRNTSENQKVFMIGIDGATFKIITPMINYRRLPHLYRLIANGSYGRLLSTIPPLSPVAWTSLSTGVNPGKHRILDFLKRKPDSYEVEICNASSRKAKPIWQLLSLSGKKVGVINIPMTYPPDPIDGFIISGMDSPKERSDFMLPPHLFQELQEGIGGYKLENTDFRNMGNNPKKVINELFSILENRFDTANYLMDKYPWDFLFLVFEATDRVQHNFWKYMSNNSNKNDRSEKYKELIYEVYEKVDEKIGILLKKLRPEDTVIVVSDHGFTSIQKGVRLNLWLANQSYLTYRKRLPAYKRLKRMTIEFAISGLKTILPEPIIKKLKRVGMRKGQDSLSYNVLPNIDMSKTKAFCISSYGIYLNLKGRDPSGTVEPGREYEILRENIMLGLLELKDPITGEKVIEKVFKREDVIWGAFSNNAPDIYFLWNKGYFFMGERQKTLMQIKAGSGKIFTPHNWSGQHEREGILIINGPHIRNNHKIGGANIMDIAPTIMYLMGLDVPKHMDGKVLTDAVNEGHLQSRPVRYSEYESDHSATKSSSGGYLEDEAGAVMDRLKGLGYLD